MNDRSHLIHRSRLLALGGLLAALALLTQASMQRAHAAGYADLTVTQTSVSHVNGPAGWGVYLVFVVSNIDMTVAAGPFTIAVRDHNYVTVETFSVSGMPAGGSQTFSHKLTPPGRCSSGGFAFKRTIVVDSTNAVNEANAFAGSGEGNNVTVVQGNYNGTC